MSVHLSSPSARSMRRTAGQAALLAGTSALALLLMQPQALARPFGSSWGSTSATTIASDAAAQAAQQAATIAKQSQAALTRATQAIQALKAAQAAARAAASAVPTTVTDGLSPGGLIVDPRVAGDPTLWQNISQPNQATSGDGKTTVTLTQSSQRAIATWQQFNVGRNTSVYFDQRAGNDSNGNAWVVLNRIDATGSPSQIQGQIKAEGTVLIINPNGIIFNGTSQIDVHSLIASSMDLNAFGGTSGAFKASGPAYVPILVNGLAQTTSDGSAILAPSDEANANKAFIGSGLFVNRGFNLPGTVVPTGNSALFSAGSLPDQSNSGIRVEAGATITTDVSGFDNGGFVALMGPQVTNAGAITTSAGQIILAAGSSVQIAEPAANSILPQTTYAVRTGIGGMIYTPPASNDVAHAINDVGGILASNRGNITLNGDAVEQLGTAEATTSITRLGSITIVANGSTSDSQVVFGPQSLTTILPDENGESVPSDPNSLAAFTGPRIDVSAPNVDFQSGSWVLAPSATMAVTGPGQNIPDGSPPPARGRVLLEAGSVIDLSGLTATRSAADYLYTFKVTSNDVADTPLAQSLIGQTVTIDLSLSGTRADGETWVGSPLFASSGAGYLANITQGVDQLLTKGGTLTFGSGVSVSNGLPSGAFVDVLSMAGSVVNVSGGMIQFTGAMMNTTQLIGADGRRYDIGSADPFVANRITNGFVVDHPRWNVTEIYSDPFGHKGYYKPGYVSGIRAGGVSAAAVNPILEGGIIGGIITGTQQRQLAQAATGAGGAQLTPDQLPNGASLTINLKPVDNSSLPNAAVLAKNTPDILGNAFGMDSTLDLPSTRDSSLNTFSTITYSTDRLTSYNLGSITISGANTLAIAEGANLSVRAGGSIKLTGVTTVDGTLTAHGGTITLTPPTPVTSSISDLTLGAHALLDVSGLWINDTGLYGDVPQDLAYINGGSISLSTGNISDVVSYDPDTEIVSAVDHSASIILKQGSVIDVSSGGYVDTSGKLALGADGLPKGNGGNLSLLTYNETWNSRVGVNSEAFGKLPRNKYTPETATNGDVVMDGTVYAGGLSQGGTFTLQVPQIAIDGQTTQVTSIISGAQAGTVVLPTSFFTDSGFGAYKLISTYGSTTVTAGTTLTLKQQNYLAAAISNLPASGARVRDFASLGVAPDLMRHAADLTLQQNAYGLGVAGDRSATAQVLIDEGARIVADPLANISLNAGGPAIVLGSIQAPGGSIAINEGYTPGTFVQPHDGLPQYIWIGGDAVLDVGGAFVRDPTVVGYTTGTVLPGGSISLTSSGGVTIALEGSTFDIAGASATIEQPAHSSFGSPGLATRQVWSNGGSLTLSNPGSPNTGGRYNSVYFAGTIDAAGGAPQATGGTLNISTIGNILITQGGDVAGSFIGSAPATGDQLRALLPTTASVSFISADTISTRNGGLDSLSLSGGLAFSGNVDLKLAGSILIDNQLKTTTLLPAGITDPTYSISGCAAAGDSIPSIGATNVTLEAGYIRFHNEYQSPAFVQLPTLADGTLTLNARQQIDLVGLPTISNAGTVNLISGGDIRLIGDYNFNGGNNIGTGIAASGTSDGYGGMPWAGALLVADNLNLTARTIYPATDTSFLLMSLGLAPANAPGTHSTIIFASNGQTPVMPLSAGGAVLVDARTIVQGGALYAPLGTIQLGFGAGQTLPGLFISGTTNNPYDPVQTNSSTFGNLIATIATDSVTLLAGSTTSVSANGLTIPYGTTTDGINWTDNGTLLNGPPAKLIVLGGGKIDTRAGAVIDGSGGGEVYATEFVPGTGGSRNALTTGDQTVYALVPGYGSALAAYDPGFTTTVAAGSTVTLTGGNGIPAGTYTLLPAEYATVPGAYRVVVVKADTGSNTAINTTTPDGSIYMTGTLGNAVSGSRSSQTALFQIQSAAVWTRYSEIDVTRGSAYFTALAAKAGTALPRLAQDAASLIVTAGTTLALNATNQFAPAAGGLGGQLDITGANLIVAAGDQLDSFGTVTNGAFTPSSDYAGYLFLDADMLSRLGIESTLIGGYRSATMEGTRITATALNLEIASDAAHPLSGPEFLFTTLAPTDTSTGARGLVVDAGSLITAQGKVAGTASSALVFGTDPVATKDANGNVQSWSAGVSGDGSLLRVSNGGVVDIVRHFVPGAYQEPTTTPAPTPPVSAVALGSLSLGEGVVLSGNTLTLDSSGTTTVPLSSSLAARNYDLSGGVVNLGGGTGGLVVSPDLIGKFAGADVVRLRSGSVINLYGSNSFGNAGDRIGTLTFDGAGLASDGGTTSITARDIALVNSQANVNVVGAGADGHLILDASGTLTFGDGAKTLSGFADVSATAGSKVLFSGSGSLDAGDAAVTLAAPLFLVSSSTSQSLATTGALTLNRGSGSAPAPDSTMIGGILSLKGGSIDIGGALIASGGSLTLEAKTGDLTLSGNALLAAAGTRITIGDLIQDTPAGTIRLFADIGNVTLGAGTTVDVSGAGSGYAGTLSVYAGGTAGLHGTLKGAARYSDLGGEFVLIAGRLDGSLPLGAGFTRSFSLSLGQGDIVIGAGQTLASENVLLVANNGGIRIDGTIDASSASGGSIVLYGAGTSTVVAGAVDASGVTIGADARLYTRYRAPDQNSPGYGDGTAMLVQKGGTITLGTTGTPDGTLNSDYGYENVSGSGAVTVASGAIFDVSGGAGGANIDNTGGSVIVRAPVLTNHSINVSFNGTVVTNARVDGTASGNPLVASAFAVWSTTDAGTDPDKHFDGIIDPAGFFDAGGTRVVNPDGSGLYPISTADAPADGAYLPHVNFYQTTLLNFVNSPFDANGVAAGFAGARLQVGGNAATAMPSPALHLRPEIDLVNPTPSTGAGSVNGGNITVASNWNFGAGSFDANGNINLAYRTTNGGEPGTLVLRAANNVQIDATISDGFFVSYDAGGSAAAMYNSALNSSAYQAYLAMFSPDGSSFIADSSATNQWFVNNFGAGLSDLGIIDNYSPSVPIDETFFGDMSPGVFQSLQFKLQPPTILSCGGIACSSDVINQYDQYYGQYVQLFRAYETDLVSLNAGGLTWIDPGITQGGKLMSYANVVAALVGIGAAPSDPNSIVIPGAPSLSSKYYDPRQQGLGSISFDDSGNASTSAQDYVTQWAAYFFNVANYNISSVQGAPLTAFIPAPTLSNVAGASASIGTLAAISVTPPYAPPAYTTLQTPDFVAVSLVNPPPPTNQIANNPAIYSAGSVPYYNTTSSANLMTAAMSGKGSFSYDLVGGALFSANGASAVNPNAMVQVSALSSTLTGNVTVDGHASYINSFNNLTVDVPTLVRTGTGSISVAAAGDFTLLDPVAPGAVYTAGYVAGNADGFTAPALPSLPQGVVSNGLLTTPVWATGGGNLIVTAGRDIVGIETPVDPDGSRFSSDGRSVGVSTGQFWSAWYYVNGKSTGSSTAPFDPSAGGVQYSTWINYGTFFQGIGALGGGNIALRAGRDVRDVSASLPETIQISGGQSVTGPAATAHYYGGGNLLVSAGNDVLSGVYYVGRGTGTIRAGGSVVSDATLAKTIYVSSGPDYEPAITQDPYSLPTTFSVPLLLAVQDGFVTVQAAGSIDLGGIFQPTRVPAELQDTTMRNSFSQTLIARTLPSSIGAAFDSYGSSSGVTLTSSTGSVTVDSLWQSSGDGGGNTDTLFVHVNGQNSYLAGGITSDLVTPNLAVTALTGDIQSAHNFFLYPSQTGQLSLIAGGSIEGILSQASSPTNVNVTMYDSGNTSLIPMLGSAPAALTAPLHAGDDTPVLIYAGEDIDGGIYTLLKQTRMWAGRDISGVTFTGMNTADSDITSIVAGRDILARIIPDVLGQLHQATSTSFIIYGPGNMIVQAGRDIGPFTTYDNGFITLNAATANYGGGIFAIGDGANSNVTSLPVKPYLPQQGANITVRYGVAGGTDYAAAIAASGDAGATVSGMDFAAGVIPRLESLLEQLIAQQAVAAGVQNPNVTVTLNPSEAADLFNALPTLVINDKLAALAARAGFANLTFNLTPAQFTSLLQQQDALKLAVDQGFLALLKQVGLDYNNTASPYYGQYARAYQAISLLYPASLGYTDNSAGGTGAIPALKHTGDLRMARTLVETQAGGDINLIGPGGNAYVGSNSADTLLPNQQGILTLQGGSIRSYTDQDVQVYQSRIFTEQGGNVELFSANGDLNAGKGPKSSASYPPLRLICDVDGYCRVNPTGLVTGAGVGALLSVPGQDPTLSNVVLSAPHGIVDFGAAGVRSANDLNVVALQVLNAFNALVGGVATGVPTVQAPPVAALATASNVAGSVQQVATPTQPGNNGQPSVMIVEIIGYGGGDGEERPSNEKKDNKRKSSLNYDPRNALRILGNGAITSDEAGALTAEERKLLSEDAH